MGHTVSVDLTPLKKSLSDFQKDYAIWVPTSRAGGPASPPGPSGSTSPWAGDPSVWAECVYAWRWAPPCLTPLLSSPERRLFHPLPVSYQAVRGPLVGFRSSWFIPDTSPLPDTSTGPPPLLCLSRNKRFSFWWGPTYPYVPSWFVFLYHKDLPSFLLEVLQFEILYTGPGPIWVSFCIYGVRVKLVSHIWTCCCQ